MSPSRIIAISIQLRVVKKLSIIKLSEHYPHSEIIKKENEVQ
jgi:hypothetical protein